jgi:hypothetical protein
MRMSPETHASLVAVVRSTLEDLERSEEIAAKGRGVEEFAAEGQAVVELKASVTRTLAELELKKTAVEPELASRSSLTLVCEFSGGLSQKIFLGCVWASLIGVLETR